MTLETAEDIRAALDSAKEMRVTVHSIGLKRFDLTFYTDEPPRKPLNKTEPVITWPEFIERMQLFSDLLPARAVLMLWDGNAYRAFVLGSIPPAVREYLINGTPIPEGAEDEWNKGRKRFRIAKPGEDKDAAV